VLDVGGTVAKPGIPPDRQAHHPDGQTVKAIVRDLQYRLDVNTLHRDESATQLGLNDIGRVSMRMTQPLFHDPYGRNRQTGGFILIDEASQRHGRRGHDHRGAVAPYASRSGFARVCLRELGVRPSSRLRPS
jgi:sulfate adenylyltransferase subunit 1 (EFTu-like GTPase family)